MFHAEGAKIAETLKMLTKVTSKAESVCIESNKRGVFMSAEEDAISIKVMLPSIDGRKNEKMEAAVSLNMLSTLCNKRKELKFEMPTDSELVFKEVKGRYAGKIGVTPYRDIEPVPEKVREDVSQMSPDFKSTLFDVLKAVAIAPLSGTPMIIRLQYSKGVMQAITGDNYHVAYHILEQDFKKVKSFSLEIPSMYVSLIQSLFGQDPTKMSMSFDENCLYVWTELMQLRLPMMASSGMLDFDTMIERTKKHFKPSTMLKIKQDQLYSALQNFFGIFDQESGSYIVVEADKKEVSLSSKTRFGSMNDAIPVHKKISYNQDSNRLTLELISTHNVLSMLSGDLTLGVTAGKKAENLSTMLLKKKNKFGTTFYVLCAYTPKEQLRGEVSKKAKEKTKETVSKKVKQQQEADEAEKKKAKKKKGKK